MEVLNHKYPYLADFGIPEEKIKEWKQSGSSMSFTWWAMKNQILPKEKYFEWAIEYYQIPFIEHDFFAQNIINRSEWNKVQDRHSWNEELVPVWTWDGTVYVGCIELPQDSKEWPQDFRPVLVTNQALTMTWKTVNVFDLEEKTRSQYTLSQQNLKNEKIDNNQESPKEDISQKNPKEVTLPSLDLSKEPKKETHTLMKEELPHKDKPEISKKSKEPNNITPITDAPSKKLEEKLSPSKKLEEKLSPSKKLEEKPSIPQKPLSELWKSMDLYFKVSAVFKNEQNILKCTDSNLEALKSFAVDLNEKSLFRVLLKNSPYHGYIAKNSIHEKLVKALGWEKWPEYITAIPFFDDEWVLQNAFLGISNKPLKKNDSLDEIAERLKSFFPPSLKKFKAVA